jgi:hypothetical protein
MQVRRERSPRIAIAMICGCVLAPLCLFQWECWRYWAKQEQTAPEQLVAKYELLRPLLPQDEVTGFVLDDPHLNPDLIQPDARLFLAQYALSPRLVGPDATSRLVIVESDCPESVPDVAAAAGWILLSDLRNGVRLYRTDVR